MVAWNGFSKFGSKDENKSEGVSCNPYAYCILIMVTTKINK
jgi:hypothetical protein